MHRTHAPVTRPLLVLVLAIVAAFGLPGCHRRASDDAVPTAPGATADDAGRRTDATVGAVTGSASAPTAAGAQLSVPNAASGATGATGDRSR